MILRDVQRKQADQTRVLAKMAMAGTAEPVRYAVEHGLLDQA